MNKTEVYSWRLRPDLKQRLEAASKARNTSMSALLDLVATAWLRDNAALDDDARRQQQIRDAAMTCFGSIGGGDPDRARQVRDRVRATLRHKRVA